MERINEKSERKNKRSVLTFLVFLAISTALWFLTKLSDDYSTQAIFSLQFEEVPADKWVSSPKSAVKTDWIVLLFHQVKISRYHSPSAAALRALRMQKIS